MPSTRPASSFTGTFNSGKNPVVQGGRAMVADGCRKCGSSHVATPVGKRGDKPVGKRGY